MNGQFDLVVSETRSAALGKALRRVHAVEKIATRQPTCERKAHVSVRFLVR
jgi:hypothetical protein